MDRRRCRKVWRRFSVRLLSVKSPVAEIDRVGRIAEIEDEDMIAEPPSVRRVIAAPADDVGYSRIAFPPALVCSGKNPRSTGLRSNHWVAAGNGAHTCGIACVCHVPDLVRGIGVGAQHVNLAIVDWQCVAIANAHHLGTTRYPVRYRQME